MLCTRLCLFVFILSAVSCSNNHNNNDQSSNHALSGKRSVSALARLIPKGDLVKLSVPAGIAITGNEVVDNWFVEEGSLINKGQVLLQLSNRDELKASLQQAQADLNESKLYLPFLIKERTRAVSLSKLGASTIEQADQAISNVNVRLGMIKSSEAAVNKAKVLLDQSLIRSPLTGTIIQIYSWPGMRETDNGLALIGRTGEMEAWAQVFQADLPLIHIGQKAFIEPEDLGFKGTINGTVDSIIGEISQRDLFAINANNDVNARVGLVKVSIDKDHVKKIENLSGLNVIVRFSR